MGIISLSFSLTPSSSSNPPPLSQTSLRTYPCLFSQTLSPSLSQSSLPLLLTSLLFKSSLSRSSTLHPLSLSPFVPLLPPPSPPLLILYSPCSSQSSLSPSVNPLSLSLSSLLFPPPVQLSLSPEVTTRVERQLAFQRRTANNDASFRLNTCISVSNSMLLDTTKNDSLR